MLAHTLVRSKKWWRIMVLFFSSVYQMQQVAIKMPKCLWATEIFILYIESLSFNPLFIILPIVGLWQTLSSIEDVFLVIPSILAAGKLNKIFLLFWWVQCHSSMALTAMWLPNKMFNHVFERLNIPLTWKLNIMFHSRARVFSLWPSTMSRGLTLPPGNIQGQKIKHEEFYI